MAWEHDDVTTAAVVLAAGEGARFAETVPGPSKLVVPIDGVPMVRRCVDAAMAAGLDETVVVVGAHAAAVRAVLPPAVTVVENAAWPDGIATSLAVAIDHAAARGHDAVVVGLGDQPGVPSSAWRAVAGATATPVAVATYDGRRRNPVRLAAAMWPDLPRTGDEGARRLLRLRPDLVTPVACEGDPHDVDTGEDLGRWS